MKFVTKSACNQSDIDLLVDASLETSHLDGDIVELGTYKGASTFSLAAKHPEKKIFACDLFGGNPYPERTEFSHLCLTDLEFEEFLKKASFFPNLVVVKGMHEATIPTLPVKKISFLFMDSDHYESHVVGLTYLAPKVVHQGIMAFHDWTFSGVRKAVIEILNPEEWEFMEGKFEYCNIDQGMAFLRKK